MGFSKSAIPPTFSLGQRLRAWRIEFLPAVLKKELNSAQWHYTESESCQILTTARKREQSDG